MYKLKIGIEIILEKNVFQRTVQSNYRAELWKVFQCSEGAIGKMACSEKLHARHLFSLTFPRNLQSIMRLTFEFWYGVRSQHIH